MLSTTRRKESVPFHAVCNEDLTTDDATLPRKLRSIAEDAVIPMFGKDKRNGDIVKNVINRFREKRIREYIINASYWINLCIPLVDRNHNSILLFNLKEALARTSDPLSILHFYRALRIGCDYVELNPMFCADPSHMRDWSMMFAGKPDMEYDGWVAYFYPDDSAFTASFLTGLDYTRRILKLDYKNDKVSGKVEARWK
jgi:hypothetical protein